MQDVGDEQHDHRAVQGWYKVGEEDEDGEGGDRSGQRVSGIGGLETGEVESRRSAAGEVGERQTDQDGTAGGQADRKLLFQTKPKNRASNAPWETAATLH